MSEELKQSEEALCALQSLDRFLDDMQAKRWPSQDHDLDGSYVAANIGHAARGAKFHQPGLKAALQYLLDLHMAAEDESRAELAEIKGGGEAVAYVSTHDLRCFIDGKYKAMTATLYDFAHPLHQPLYAHQPVVAEAEPVGSKVGAIEGGVVPGWRVTGRGGYSLCVQYPEWAEGCDDLKIEQLFAAPPASGAVPVPYGFIGELHEYLDNCAQFDPAYPPETQPDNRAAALLLNLRALLAKEVL